MVGRTLSVLAAALCILAPACHAGIQSASVTLAGPAEGWVETDLDYTATPHYTFDTHTQQEITAGNATVQCEYQWWVSPARLIAGGTSQDNWAKINYAYQNGGAYQTVRVDLTVHLDFTNPNDPDDNRTCTASITVKVKRPELGALSRSKATICAGGRPNAVHQVVLSTSVTDGFGGPASGRVVTFTALPHEHVVQAATLSPAGPVTTNAAGSASVTLTSPDQPGTVIVEASTPFCDSQSIGVTVASPAATPTPTPPIVLRRLGDQALQELLTCGGAAPVTDHSLLWTIGAVLDADGQAVVSPTAADYGHVEAVTDPTTTAGVGAGHYYAGTKGGTITVRVTDQNCYTEDDAPLSWEIEIQVKQPHLETLVSSRPGVCAGALPSDPHRCTITAHVTNGSTGPSEACPVTFTIVVQSYVATPATLSVTAPVLTSASGNATVTLTSSDMVGLVSVEAEIDGDDPKTVDVEVLPPSSAPTPDDQIVIPQAGLAGQPLQEVLELADLKVPGHVLAWEIAEVCDENGDVVEAPTAEDYGSLDPATSGTNYAGLASSVYHPGAELGTIVIVAKDTSCYDETQEHPVLDVFVVVVAALDHLEVSGAYPYDHAGTTKWATSVADDDSYVTVTAVLKPDAAGAALANGLWWEGGLAVEGEPLVRHVLRASAGAYDVTAHLGMSMRSANISVCECSGIWVESGQYICGGPYGDEWGYWGLWDSPDSAWVAKADAEDTAGLVLQAQVWPLLPVVPEQLLRWDPNLGGPVEGHPELRRVPLNEPARRQVACHCGSSTATADVLVVGFEAALDNDEVYVNSDDDNTSTVSDLTETSVEGENDLVGVQVRALPEGLAGFPGSIGIGHGVSHTSRLEVWCTSHKALLAPTLPLYPWQAPIGGTAPATYWIEGRQASNETGDQTVTVTGRVWPQPGTVSYPPDYIPVSQMMYEGRWWAANAWFAPVDIQQQASLTVLPREGDSEAYLKLYKNSGLTTEALGSEEIGGTVYPTLYVKVAPGDRVRPGASATLRIKDLYAGYDPVPTNVSFDMAINLAAASGWERQTGPETWVPSYGPAWVDNKDGATPLVYRYRATWNTAITPLGCNGPHSVGTVAPLEFQKWVVDTGWTNDNTCGPATLKPTVKNLIVSNVKVTEGTVDYFKWDPDAGGTLAAPVISFTIEDADPHTYDCVVYYRSTSGSQTWAGNDYWAATQTGCEPGTVIFNLANAGLDGHLDPGVHDWGPYTFDIVVTEHDGAAQVDRYGYKEPYCMWVPATGGDAKAGHDAQFAMAEGASAPELRVTYWLNDQCNRDAQEMAVVVLDPALDERANEGVPTTVGARHEGTDEDSDGEPDWIDGSIPDWIPVYTVGTDDIGGDWRALWTGADACGPKTQHRRTHDEQRTLVANKGIVPKEPTYTAYNMDFTWEYYPDYNPYCTDDTKAHGLGQHYQPELQLPVRGNYAMSLLLIHTASECLIAQEAAGFHARRNGGTKIDGKWEDASNALKENTTLFTFNGHANAPGQPGCLAFYDRQGASEPDDDRWEALFGTYPGPPPNGMAYWAFRDCWGWRPPAETTRLKHVWFALLLGCHMCGNSQGSIADELVHEGANGVGGFDCEVRAPVMQAFAKYFWDAAMGHSDRFTPWVSGPVDVQTAGEEALQQLWWATRGSSWQQYVPSQGSWYCYVKSGGRTVIAPAATD